MIKNQLRFNDAFNCSDQTQLESFELLTIITDLKNFNYNYFKNFLSFELNKIEALTSSQFLQGCQQGFFTSDDLKDFLSFEPNKIKALR